MSISWSTNTPETKPKTREGSAYATSANLVWIFGGALYDEYIPVPIETNELWEFNSNTNIFTQIKPADGSAWPSTRSNSTISHLDNKLYLHGGITEKSGWLNDFWVFDIASSTWTEIDQAENDPKPGPRSMHSINAVKYGSKLDRPGIFLFGGFGPQEIIQSSSSNGNGNSQEDDGDDWEDASEDGDLNEIKQTQQALSLTRKNDGYLYDLETKQWQPLFFESQCPEARAAHKVVYDETNGRCILMGGKSNTVRLSDIFYFDLKTLAFKYVLSETSNRVTPRSFHEICIDSKNSQVYVHGGRDQFNNHLSEVIKISPEYETFESNIAVGAHMFFTTHQGKFYIYGGSSEFNAELGYCEKFHDTLYTGTLIPDIKKPRLDNIENLENVKITNSQ